MIHHQTGDSMKHSLLLGFALLATGLLFPVLASTSARAESPVPFSGPAFSPLPQGSSPSHAWPKDSPVSSRNKGAETKNAPAMASRWSEGYKSRVRIVSDDSDFPARPVLLAGIHVQMAPGWKTYWRSPGDTGVPPSFDWTGSENVKSMDILWPVPQTYKDDYSVTIGYKKEIVLPVRIIVRDKNKPVRLKLAFDFGICDKICVPVETSHQLTIPPRQKGYKSLMARYLSTVPKTVKSTGVVANGFSIRKVSVDLKGKKPGIIIDASVPENTGNARLYAEASGNFYLPLAVDEPSQSGKQRRFRIDLSRGDPPEDLAGRTLSLTLVGDNAGIEYRTKIN